MIDFFEITDAGQHSDRVTRKRQARLRHIVREALALAAAEGGDALTLQRLADRLDYTPGALYRYFPSKEALVAELQRVVLAWLAVRTEQCRAAADDAAPGLAAPDAALLGVIATARAFEQFSEDAPVEFGLLSMYLGDPEPRLPDAEAGRVYESAERLLAALAEQLESAAHAGALAPGDADERALALWAGLQGAAGTRKLARSAPGRIDPKRVSRGLLAALLAGWGAPRTEALFAHADAAIAAAPARSLDELLALES